MNLNTAHTRAPSLRAKQQVLCGEQIVTAMREIIKNQTAAWINGVFVDMFSASFTVAVYDRVSDVSKERLRKMSVMNMITTCMKLCR